MKPRLRRTNARVNEQLNRRDGELTFARNLKAIGAPAESVAFVVRRAREAQRAVFRAARYEGFIRPTCDSVSAGALINF